MSNRLSNNDIDKFIQELLNSDLNSLSYPEIHSLYFQKFKILSTPTIHLDRNFMDTLSIFRSRPISKIKENEIKDYSKYSSPPINVEVGFGRCHWNGRNVFYGSDNALSSLKETKKEYKECNEFYVGEWSINTEKIKNSIAASFFLSDKISPKNPWSFFLPKIEEFYKSNAQTKVKNLKYLNKKLSDLFIQITINQYRLTAFISNQILYGVNKNPLGIWFPMLIYPSIESNSESCNFAIHPAFAWEYMSLQKIYHIKLNEEVKKGVKINLLKIGLINDLKEIKWYKIQTNIYKALHRIESIYCECGEKYSYTDLKKVKLIRNNQNVTINEITKIIFQKNEHELVDFGENFPFTNGKPKAFEITFNEKLDGFKLIANEVEHTNLYIHIKFLMPVIYEEYK